MTARCVVCSESFSDQETMLNHFLNEHLLKLEFIPCTLCEKEFVNMEDLFHHIQLNHKVIDSTLLENATVARDIKKQAGMIVHPDIEGIGFECNFCFQQFSNIEKMIAHGKKEHDREFHPDFLERIKKVTNSTNNGKAHPVCHQCKKKFLGIIFARINNKIQEVCFNCYEDYFGANALTRLTIGTNEDAIKMMRKPL